MLGILASLLAARLAGVQAVVSTFSKSFKAAAAAAVGTGVLLAASGLTLAVVPALRRRRVLVTAWVLSAGAFSLAVLVNLVRLVLEFT